MKILHVADTHIKNLKYHDEYRQVFNEIYRIAREQKVDCIVHCGDIAHTKTQISPEFVEMASDFFRNLALIAPTYVILGNHDCLSDDHEILTKNSGWTNISEYVNSNSEEEIATFSKQKQKVEWQKPYGLIKKYFNGELINFKGSKIDQLVTPTHQILYKPYSKSELIKNTADQIKIGNLIPITGKQDDLIDDYYYQLLGFSFADGTFVLRNDTKSSSDIFHNSRVHFHFKKERKIQYLSNLLNNLDYSYNICPQNDGTSYIRIYSKLGKDICKFFSGKKEIPLSLLSLTENQIKNFIIGYLNGDGHKIAKNTYSAFSVCKNSVDILYTAARLVGYSSNINEKTIFGNYKNSKQQYGLYITINQPNKFSSITSIEKIKYDNYVYCVGVPNENFLVKRNNKISITGNCNLKNDSRTDAISPIINALNLSNLHLFKYSGEFAVNDQVTFNVLSRIDEDKWVKPSDPSKINIALYHGSIAGVQTDIGYVMEHGEFNVDIFEGHDFAFLGDIHKTNQIVDTAGRVRYPGSTVQQNFGETDDKGILIWDIVSKDEFSCKHYVIPNPCPFVTIVLDDNGAIPELEVKSGARIRIVADKNISLDKIKKATEIVRTKFSPESITFVNKASGGSNNEQIITDAISQEENLRDLKVQENLIRNYLKDFNAEEEVMTKVVDLNKRFSSHIEENEEVLRNVNWKLKSIEWDNLFNYGEGNSINFDNLNGIVGIFGKNYSGKSSVIDSLLYTIYNTTSKNNRKNLNVINQNRDKGFGKVTIEIDDELYTINRSSEKYIKKLKGVTTVEAKTDVEFTTDGESLNGLARNDTDKSIRKFFGTVDDFFLTSMASQFGYLSFISEGSTNRKQILAKFLDLENFDKKFKLAKEESSSVKAILKKLEGNDYNRDISLAELEIVGAENYLKDKQALAETLKNVIDECNEHLCQLNKSLVSVPQQIIDLHSTENTVKSDKTLVQNADNDNLTLTAENEKLNRIIAKATELLGMIDINEIVSGKKDLEELNKQIIPLEKEISSLSTQLNGMKHKLNLLNDIPCGDSFPDCKFIRDAFLSKKQYSGLNNQIDGKNTILAELNNKYDVLDAKIADLSNKQAEISKKKLESERKLASNELKIEKNNVFIQKTNKSIEENETKIKNYLENREAIENYEKLHSERQNYRAKLDSTTRDLKNCEAEIIEAHRKHGSATQKCADLNKQKLELDNLRKEYAAYDLFLSCMHPNGISYEIIKQKLPVINTEIAKILTNIVEFGVYLENDDDKLDIMIKHPKYDARPLEMGSGAEKTIASVAIRLALLNVTTLPRSDFFVMDEPGTALDPENLDGFIRILELIKTYFKTVILISHLDALKDCVDTQIVIEKRDGFAYVNQ